MTGGAAASDPDMAGRIPPFRWGGFEMLKQFPTKNMVIDFDDVTRGLIKSSVPRTHLAFDALADVGRTFQISCDLQSGDTSLMIGETPDATERLKQAYEK